ncbi:MAG: 30S ribosomal protein S16 [bacterium]|nr:30S ribosomal protein S16 [bacterium]
MLKIRLTRRGKKNRPFFRIVVAEKSAPIKGRFIEILGFLDPLTKKVGFKAERIKYWISKGAQPSDTVHNLLVTHKIISGPKIKKFPHQKKKEETKEKTETAKDKAVTPAEEAQAVKKDKTEEKKTEAPEPTPIKQEPSEKEEKITPPEAKPLTVEKNK